MIINKNNVEDILSLGHMQSGMLYHYLLDKDPNEYFQQLELIIGGFLDYDLFEKTWEILVANNEMLRAVYRWQQVEKPIQVVLKEVSIKIEYKDFSNDTDTKESIKEIKVKDKQNKFNLEVGPLLRVYVCKIEEERHSVIISNHHIIYDGWSTGILLKECFQIYDELLNGRKWPIYHKAKFKEYLKWLNKRDMTQYSNFWSKYLDNLKCSPINIATNKSNDGKQIKQESRSIPSLLTKEFNELSKNRKTTMATIFNLAWGILLQRYSGSNDVIFGTTVSGRVAEIKNIDQTVGLFINTIPLRLKFPDDATVEELLEKLDSNIMERSAFENTELINIKEYCKLKADDSLFDTVMVIENYPLEKMLFQNNNSLHIENYSILESTNYDLLISIEIIDTIIITLNYNSNKYPEFLMKNMLAHYMNILKAISVSNTRINEITILDPREKEQIISEFNPVNLNDHDTTIDALFEEQVQKNPDAVAIIYEDKELTYKQLDTLSNKLAKILRVKIQQEDFVGIMLNRSMEMVISMLAILKAGKAYIPIDSSYPKDRIQYILRDSNIKLLITEDKLVEEPIEGVTLILVNEIETNSEECCFVDKNHTSQSHAYCIYTSGSTGNPKGVIIKHQSIVNTLLWRSKYYQFSSKEGVMQLPSFSFDSSVEDIFTPLISGSKLVIMNEEKRKDVDYIKHLIESQNITHFLIIPSLYNVLLDEVPETLKSLKFITIAGELCPDHIIEKHFKLLENVELHNEYGPSENSVCTTVKKLDKTTKGSNIGRVIDNTQCFVMANNNLQPIGVAGELCISGVGLSQGYLNNIDLTDEKFILNSNIDGSIKRIYKTGDLVRWLPEGELEFLGRIDNQVKIRGFRIEKEEIENLLLKYPEIKSVVVSVISNPYGKELIAYIVSDKIIDIDDLKIYLSKKLPYYSVPAYISQIAHIPKGPNGKIDMKAIENMDLVKGLESKSYKKPKNETEERLEKIWCKLLNVQAVSVDSKFFDIGGNSLKIMTLASLINKEFNSCFNVSDLFKYSTIESIAEKIEEDHSEEDEVVVYKY
ncbi:non-ribosomal peptide synthetase [Alkaliphilus transvaalensis]|uniref:non-ribosomal peptide synthetase n=1 Tax=Alkaliphilus transvaalensis TaxID=114628 RepID=UPI000478EB74|nr:non-ribosomal peptide synthetase [Alkaliphilus transvaalensis]